MTLTQFTLNPVKREHGRVHFLVQVYVPQMNTVPQMNKIENSTLEMSTTNLSLGIDNMTKMVQKQ